MCPVRSLLAVCASLGVGCGSSGPDRPPTDGSPSDAGTIDSGSDATAGADAATDAGPDGSPGRGCELADLPTDLGLGLQPAIAYASGHFAVAYWSGELEGQVALFDESGRSVGSDAIGRSGPPTIAGGESFLLAWVEGISLELAPLTPGGGIGAATTIAAKDRAAFPVLAASPVAREFAVVFVDHSGGLDPDGPAMFLRVEADGTPIAGPTEIVPAGEYVTSIAFRPGGWSVAIRAPPELRVVRLGGDGDQVGSTVVSTADWSFGSLVGAGAETGLAWLERMGRTGSVLQFTTLGEDGALLGEPVVIAESETERLAVSSIAFDGTHYVVPYLDIFENVHVARVTPGGEIADDLNLAEGPRARENGHPVATVSGDGILALAWPYEGDDWIRIRFSLLDCS